MASIVIFEDNPSFLQIIETVNYEHYDSRNCSNTIKFLYCFGQALCGELETDFILVDRNLRQERHDLAYHFGRLVPAAPESKRGLLARRRVDTSYSEEVVYGSSYEHPGQHAKVIVDVMQRYSIVAQTIGISADSMEQNGVKVEYDLTKFNLNQLAESIVLLVQSSPGCTGQERSKISKL